MSEPDRPGKPGSLAVRLFFSAMAITVVVLAVVAVAVPLLARVEVRLIPREGPGLPPRGLAEVGYALFTAGTWAVWQFGAVLHPLDPAGLLAALLFAAGVVVLRRATSR